MITVQDWKHVCRLSCAHGVNYQKLMDDCTRIGIKSASPVMTVLQRVREQAGLVQTDLIFKMYPLNFLMLWAVHCLRPLGFIRYLYLDDIACPTMVVCGSSATLVLKKSEF